MAKKENKGMQLVHPIRTEDEQHRVQQAARRHDQMHGNKQCSWELLWIIGIATGLRISDILRLKVKDVRNPVNWEIRLAAKKTGKELGGGEGDRIPDWAHRPIQTLTKGRDGDEWLFQSRQRDNVTGRPKAISRERAWMIINEFCRAAGIKGHVGCHTLRKTYGMNHYEQFKDMEALRQHFCHSSHAVTQRYIGLDKEKQDEYARRMRSPLMP